MISNLTSKQRQALSNHPLDFSTRDGYLRVDNGTLMDGRMYFRKFWMMYPLQASEQMTRIYIAYIGLSTCLITWAADSSDSNLEKEVTNLTIDNRIVNGGFETGSL